MDRFTLNQNENKSLKIALAGVRLALRVLILVLIVMAVIHYGKKIYALGYEAFSAKPQVADEKQSEEVRIVITKNMELKDICLVLNENGLIKESEEAFLIQAKSYGYSDTIVPGTYLLNTSMTVEEILETMSPMEKEDG